MRPRCSALFRIIRAETPGRSLQTVGCRDNSRVPHPGSTLVTIILTYLIILMPVTRTTYQQCHQPLHVILRVHGYG